ncbi:MAG: acyl-CoA dehydrogenase family protein [Nitrospinota bacterium]
MVEFVLDEELKSWQTKAAEFARQELKPYAAEWDRTAGADPASAFPMEALKRCSRAGLRTVTVPKEMGGAGLGILGHCILLEELFQGEAGFASVIHQGWKLAKLLCHFTTDAQREEFLPRFMDVETSTMAIGLTEPGHGTDNILPYTHPSGGLQLSAKQNSNGWVLNGMKHFIACAAMSNINFLMTRTNPEAPVNEGCTMFIMHDEVAGFRRGKVHGKLGARLLMNAEMIYEDCEIPDSWRLSEVDQGLPYMAQVFSRHSPTTATFAVGIARAAFEDALKYAGERIQGGVPIIQHEGIRTRLADMYTSLTVARDAIWRAAWHADTAPAGEFDFKEGLRVALFASEMAPQVCTTAMNVFGGNGYMWDHPAERHMRDAMMCYHIDGMNDVMRMKLGALLAGEAHAGAL